MKTLKEIADTKDFFNKVNEKTGQDFWYFAEQYFYSPNQPELEYYQTNNEFYFRWNNINENFVMPIGILVNGVEERVTPSKDYQSFKIEKHSQIEIMDWKFYVLPKKASIN